MGSFDFEGKPVSFAEGDTVASALFRAGVRTFSRSLKYHRRRGLYCMTGDCPNCILTVDGEPGLRSCCTDAREGASVERGEGWPSTERDLLSVADHAHRLLPVGFYYKTFTKPRFAWPLAEKVIRRTTGLGDLDVSRPPQVPWVRHLSPDVLVIGGGIAGLAAARAAVSDAKSVLLCDEGRIGEKVAPGGSLDRIRALETEVRALEGVTVMERSTAVGIYDGPLVPIARSDELLRVRPERVVVAAGAVETHRVFEGNDLPGVWLGRGAARLAGVHGVRPGDRAVVVASTAEGLGHASTLLDAGARVALVAPKALTERWPADSFAIPDGTVVRAHGSKWISAVDIAVGDDVRKLNCDSLVLSLGLEPRDGLLRMSAELDAVVAAGDAAGVFGIDAAEESGTRAGRGEASDVARLDETRSGTPVAGYVCICEDVAVSDLDQAWEEGWHSSEILKRYTTATMGPCQGALCGRHLARFAEERSGSAQNSRRTTSRPPARPIRLDTLAAGIDEIVEKRTSLHDVHLESGAHLGWSGSWKRPFSYGDWRAEYHAVREDVSVMDVGTLGKFLVAGRDARTLLDRVFPTRVSDLADGRARYLLALDEAGYVMDDGIVSAAGDGRFFVTSTSGGADAMEAWLRNWGDRLDLHVHLVNQTAMLGAILLAGPHAREVLASLTSEDVSADAFPYMAVRDLEVAGVPCRALRVGFVGELGYELHHPRGDGRRLWEALASQGTRHRMRPHGLDAMDLLRLEKGHVFLAQDTLPDDHPRKLGMEWALDMEKETFVGKAALQRMAELPLERKLVGLEFDRTPERGAPLHLDDRVAGRVTSCSWSDVLGKAIGLGWLRAVDGRFATRLRCGDAEATVVETPFYDPEGRRLRA
ncbi:MAG: 2Fe-2S iron-sulfur cluster-binding protein [Actinomycetota bacterium]